MGSAMCTCHLEQPTLKRPAILREQHRAPKHPVKTTASRPLVTMTTAIEIVPQYTTPSPTETVRAALPSEEGNQAATAHTVQFPIHTLSDVPVHESISIHSTRPFGTRRSAGQLIRSASTSGAASSNAAGTSHNLGRWRPLSNLDESTSHNLSLISDDSGDHHVPPRHARARTSVATVLAPVALMGGRNDSTTSGSSFTSNEQQPCTGVGNSFRQINAVEPRKSAIGGPRFVTI